MEPEDSWLLRIDGGGLGTDRASVQGGEVILFRSELV